VRSWAPTALMLALIVGLSVTSVFDPHFRWLAGTLALALAALALLWFRFRARWGTVRGLIRTLDWDTTLFLIGVFIVVGGISASGWLERIAGWITAAVGTSRLQAFVLIILVSVFVSAFVDNVPFLLTMIPVTQKVADGLGAETPLLMFGLLIGSCLGGNITPIGASANVVAVGMLRKRHEPVSFREFMAVGIPFTAAAVVAAGAFVWLVWGPR